MFLSHTPLHSIMIKIEVVPPTKLQTFQPLHYSNHTCAMIKTLPRPSKNGKLHTLPYRYSIYGNTARHYTLLILCLISSTNASQVQPGTATATLARVVPVFVLRQGSLLRRTDQGRLKHLFSSYNQLFTRHHFHGHDHDLQYCVVIQCTAAKRQKLHTLCESR